MGIFGTHQSPARALFYRGAGALCPVAAPASAQRPCPPRGGSRPHTPSKQERNGYRLPMPLQTMPTRAGAGLLSQARTPHGALRHPIHIRFGSTSATAELDFTKIEWAPWGSGVSLVIHRGFVKSKQVRNNQHALSNHQSAATLRGALASSGFALRVCATPRILAPPAPWGYHGFKIIGGYDKCTLIGWDIVLLRVILS